MAQKRLTPGRLLDQNGALAECGFATSPVRAYDRRAIKAGRLRIKEWDYYLVYNQDIGIALTIADNAYMGMGSVSFLDFQNRTEHTCSPITLLPLGRIGLPPSSGTGDVTFRCKSATISFSNVNGRRRLSCNMPDFAGGQPIDLDIELGDEPVDSMVIATPFADQPKAFYYNQKIAGMRARGQVTLLGKSFNLDPDCTFGILDWGRGVWTYDNTWYWGAGQGLVNGRLFAFNIGCGFGDTRAATENMLFLDGRAHKLDEVFFNIPRTAGGLEDYMKPWTFTSSDGRFEMDFQPILDRQALTALGVLKSDQHQVFGYFSGKAVLDDGDVILLDHFLGFAEKVHNKW